MSFIDPEVLIIEVESRPLLYAKALPEYSNKIMKNYAWEDITKKLSDDWETLTKEEKNSRTKDIQAKWKHLRDNFRREYQAQRDITSGQGSKKRKKYRYYDQLLFLVPHVKEAKTSGNYITPLNVSEQNIESPSTPNSPNSSAGPSSGAESSTAALKVSETPKKRKTTSSFENAVLKAINNEMSESDEDKAFCLSLVQPLRKLDNDTKMLAKIEILNVIRTFTNRTCNSYEPNQSPFNRPIVQPYFTYKNSHLLDQQTPIYTQTPQQQDSQSETTFIYTQTPQHQYSQPTFVNPAQQTTAIKILENRQYRPANPTIQSSRPHSAQSFFTTFNTSICPSPLNTDSLSSTSVQSPSVNISSPEEYYMSPNDC